MPFTKLLPVDPQPETPEAGHATLLQTGEWIASDEVAVELDTGERVALACVASGRDFASQTVHLTTTARLLDAQGGTAVDGGQTPAHIATSWVHGVTMQAIDAAGGLDTIRTECLRLALGEPPAVADGLPLIPVSDAIRDAVSIRRAIAAAEALSAANLGGSSQLL